MSRRNRWKGSKLFWLSAAAVILACDLTGTGPSTSNTPDTNLTEAALEMQATTISIQATQTALSPGSQATSQPTPPVAQPTIPTAVVPTQNLATPTQDVEARIKSAKILVYENTDASGIGMWAQDALDGLGLAYTQTGSYSGHFMQNLDSGTPWDLIIVDAEAKDIISGEFWDVINTRLGRDKTALIVELWYLQNEVNGPINEIMGGCGIRYLKVNPLASSIYWWVPDNPVFNQPNTVLPLVHYHQYWPVNSGGDGDRITLGSGGEATLLAGNSSSPSNDGGVLAICYQGRVIFQTFSDHDYNQADIVPLWQNYIHYTLKNHFAVVP